MTQPITINESFRCGHCYKPNQKATKSCRNHCKYCLYSKHVDDEVPGDRKSNCHGLMEPVAIIYHSQKGQQIVHKCLVCKKEMVNKLANDDCQEVIIKMMQKQNLQTLPSHSKKYE